MLVPDGVAITPIFRNAEPVTELSELLRATPLSDIQQTAEDLYSRGFNVFPLPTVYEWRARADYLGNENKKPPYMAEQLYYSRLHKCNPECKHTLTPSFTDLFFRSNVGLMLGRTSQNAFEIDCDSPYAFESIHAELDGREIAYWAWKSPRGGKFLLRLAEGEAANMPQTLFDNVQIWGSKHYTILPPSLHPTGEAYYWLTPEPRTSLPKGATIPTTSIKSLAWLGLTLRKLGKETDLFGLPEWAGKLSQKNRDTLANGAHDGERNTRLAAVAYDMAGCEIDQQDAETALINSAKICVPPYSVRSVGAILKSAFQQERTPAKGYRGQSGNTEWERASMFAQAYKWREHYGRKAAGLRRTFLAMIERAKQEKRKVFRASLREIAELADTSHTRVKENLFALRELITPNGNTATGTGLYSFSKIVQTDNTISPCNTLISLAYTDNEKDTFGKLGYNAFRLWRHLQVIPTGTGYAMAKALNMPASSVYTALRTLKNSGLVTLSEGLHYGENVTDDTLGNFALDLGSNGKTQKRRERHALDRELRNNKLMSEARRKFNGGK